MSKRKCVVCGKDPAEGYASINDEFYCHGDTLETTCYMAASCDGVWRDSHGTALPDTHFASVPPDRKGSR